MTSGGRARGEDRSGKELRALTRRAAVTCVWRAVEDREERPALVRHQLCRFASGKNHGENNRLAVGFGRTGSITINKYVGVRAMGRRLQKNRLLHFFNN